MPFGFHLAMDTLPSEELTSFSGQRGITPAFGYGPPHPSARRTSTFPNNALLSTHYSAVRLLEDVHAGRTATAFSRRPAAVFRSRHLRGLPVLVHEVSRRVWGLRLRRTAWGLALSTPVMLPSVYVYDVGVLIAGFRSSIPIPPIPLFMLHCAPLDA